MVEIRLRPELVPGPLWGRSLHRTLPDSQWRRLRREVDAVDSTCEFCGDRYDKGMVCHEHWDYDDDRRVATLQGFGVACRACSFALHPGQAAAIGKDDLAVEQMIRVNGMTEDEVRLLIRDAMITWGVRSTLEGWAVRIDPALVERFPVLFGLTL